MQYISMKPFKMHSLQYNTNHFKMQIIFTRVLRNVMKPRFAVFMNETAPALLFYINRRPLLRSGNIDPFLRDIPYHKLITFYVIQDRSKTLAIQCHAIVTFI